MRRKRSMEIAQIIDDSLYEYYTIERGLPVPNWRKKDPEWWINYLKTHDTSNRPHGSGNT
jgi:hypothetical protein